MRWLVIISLVIIVAVYGCSGSKNGTPANASTAQPEPTSGNELVKQPEQQGGPPPFPEGQGGSGGPILPSR